MAEILDEMMQGNDTQKGRFLTFSLSNEEYGIDILKVQEIRGYDRNPNYYGTSRIAGIPAGNY